MRIPILIEPSFDQASVWCGQMRAGIEAEAARKKYEILLLDGQRYREIDDGVVFPERRLLVLIGTSPSWIPQALAFLQERRVEVILASYQPPENMLLRGIVRMDYVSGVSMLLQYMRSCSKTRTALYGCCKNSSTDEIKAGAFTRFLAAEGDLRPESAVFYNDVTLAECYGVFREQRERFDSVICVNDVAAASLITHLGRDGVPVPGRLYVAGFGNTEIARLFRPGITIATLDHEAVGRQLVSLYTYLFRSETDAMVTVRVKCRLNINESTAHTPAVAGYMPSLPLPQTGNGKDFYQDDEVRAFTRLEKLLVQCDDFDLAILRGLMAEETYEGLAERLDAPLTTLRYRVKRMAQWAEADSRSGLTAFLRDNGFAGLIV